MTSLLEFILTLLRDPVAQEQFKANPQQALRDHGFDEVCGQDVHDALPLVVDNVMVSGTGGNLPSPQPGEDHFDIAIRQIDHIVHNYSYTDSHDANVDYSVHQTIWTQGDVNQSFDNDYGNGNQYDNDTITANDSTVVDGDANATATGDADLQNFGQGDVTGNSGNNSEHDSHEVTHQDSQTTIDTSYHHEHEHDVDVHHGDQHGLVDVDVDDTLNDVDLLSHNDVDLLNGLHL
ncbi:IniB N-terminal domain-containing protein [Lentzea flava]|uniref:Uncharacterized protein n=1 Tax=Lentzea flava TaxID=103732 RepID=A0ABQ2V7T6_9PSEU|nr:IniB N-terminal domain-containing protein [Lentzea flava]MCP2203715.1 hypothetical protein [Lentzea flava]GGU71517.1 hypothetical protein GCM10010178_74040 [Lentzea flava]